MKKIIVTILVTSVPFLVNAQDVYNVYKNGTQHVIKENIKETSLELVLPESVMNNTFYFKQIKDGTSYPIEKYTLYPSSDGFNLSDIEYGSSLQYQMGNYQYVGSSGGSIFISSDGNNNIKVINRDNWEDILFLDVNFNKNDKRIVLETKQKGGYIFGSYVFTGISWDPSYKIIVDLKGYKLDFEHFVDLSNNTNVSVEGELKLFNSAVKRDYEQNYRSQRMEVAYADSMTASAPAQNNISKEYLSGKRSISISQAYLEPNTNKSFMYDSISGINFDVEYDFHLDLNNVMTKEKYIAHPNYALSVFKNEKTKNMFDLFGGDFTVYDRDEMTLLKNGRLSSTSSNNLKIGLGEYEAVDIVVDSIKENSMSIDFLDVEEYKGKIESRAANESFIDVVINDIVFEVDNLKEANKGKININSRGFVFIDKAVDISHIVSFFKNSWYGYLNKIGATNNTYVNYSTVRDFKNYIIKSFYNKYEKNIKKELSFDDISDLNNKEVRVIQIK